MTVAERIAGILTEAVEKIDEEEYAAAVGQLNTLIDADSGVVDDRLIAEVKLIEKLITYKKALKEWEYPKFTRQVYEYCEKKYATDFERSLSKESLPDKDVVWCCWLQGLEQAPELVKVCVASLEKLGKEICIITADNYEEYVSLPGDILEKWKAGIISNTHFSDLLRVELLAERGGLWIDATVFCSDAEEILDVLRQTDFFAYSFAMRVDLSKCMLFDSWFLYAGKKNPVIEETRQMLWAYWEKENCLMHYFLFHLIFSCCCRRHPDIWKKIPVYSMEPCHILQQEMMEKYNPTRWKQIMSMSGIHKLTYKYDQDRDISGTMLEHFLYL